MSSENKVIPATFSTSSTAKIEVSLIHSRFKEHDQLRAMKDVSGVSSEIAVLGSTNAPVETSETRGVEDEDGREARTTLAKCVGTPTLGEFPMTSYD